MGSGGEDEKAQKPEETAEGRAAKDKKDDKKDEDLSEEDLKLKGDLELMVERLQDKDIGIAKNALVSMRDTIRSATASMTSVPKPLKFLRPHYDTITAFYETVADEELKKQLADVLSVLAMTMASEDSLASLDYKLKGNAEDLAAWGHEYVRNLAGEIGKAYAQWQEEGKSVDSLLMLVMSIAPFHMEHNAEPDAVDLLLEVDKLQSVTTLTTKDNYARTARYIVSCATYLPEPEDKTCLEVAYDIYIKEGDFTEALRVAIQMNDKQRMLKVLTTCTDPLMRKQLAFILGRQGMPLDLDEEESIEEEERETLIGLSSNSRLTEWYLELARDLDVMEAKTPEDVYKVHLLEGRQPSIATVDSARANLSSTFVNAFLNAGFGQDKLVVSPPTDESGNSVHWLYKNKEHGKMSATASLGMILMWDVEGGLPQIDKHLYSSDNFIVAGALLAVGIVNSGVQNECDPAFALLYDSVNKENTSVRVGAILGLGLAYAGCYKTEILELLTPVITDSKSSVEVAGFAALALGLVYVGSCNEEAVQAIVETLMERGESELTDPMARFLCLGLGLLFLGRGDIVEPTLEMAKTFSPKIAKFCQIVLDTCAYAGTGNVLKVQQLLGICSEHVEPEESTWHQGAAILGIAMIAMGEELGSKMAFRALEHILHYCDVSLRRAVPLAIALLSISNPQYTVADMLSRLSHDHDTETAQNATLALGLISAGTNNARNASLLRSLSSFYYKVCFALGSRSALSRSVDRRRKCRGRSPCFCSW